MRPELYRIPRPYGGHATVWRVGNMLCETWTTSSGDVLPLIRYNIPGAWVGCPLPTLIAELLGSSDARKVIP